MHVSQDDEEIGALKPLMPNLSPIDVHEEPTKVKFEAEFE